MNLPSSIRSLAPLLLVACGIALFLVNAQRRVAHIDAVSALGQTEVRTDPRSPTGYANEVRRLIIPGHNEASYRWIAQTQQVAATGQWHLRHVEYDNYPLGHAVSTPSPYRWWLEFVGRVDRLFSGTSAGLAIERAALWADPCTVVIVSLIVFFWLSRRSARWIAACVTLALLSLFPWIGNFSPGLPGSEGWSHALLMLSILLLLPKSTAGKLESFSENRFGCILAGIAGGLALWVDLPRELIVEIAISIGIAVAILVGGRNQSRGPRLSNAWRVWSWAGAMTILLGWLAEAGPDQFAVWKSGSNHPMYAVAWLGIGECLGLLSERKAGADRAQNFTPGDRVALGIACLCIAACPLVAWRMHVQGVLAAEPSDFTLSKSLSGAVAPTLWSWLLKDGMSLPFLATLAPTLLALPALFALCGARVDRSAKALVLLLLIPFGALTCLAFFRLNDWAAVDAALAAVLAGTLFIFRVAKLTRFFQGSVVLLIFVFAFEVGATRFFGGKASGPNSVTADEARELVERDLADWLVKKSGPSRPVILAPSNDTSALCYYGSVRGLAALDQDNADGWGAAVRIAAATSADEAHELLLKREITHIIIPSWDSQLDDYARIGGGQVAGSFIDTLDRWRLPAWLRAEAFLSPQFQDQNPQSITVLKLVDEQDNAALYGRLAEYAVEMNKQDLLPALLNDLHRFPGDIGALVATANIQLALGDNAAAEDTVKSLDLRLSARGKQRLAWDRRVSLAVLLAREQKFDRAKEQSLLVFTEANVDRVRDLSPAALYHLLVLGKAFHQTFPAPEIEQIALGLLSPEAQSRLAAINAH